MILLANQLRSFTPQFSRFQAPPGNAIREAPASQSYA